MASGEKNKRATKRDSDRRPQVREKAPRVRPLEDESKEDFVVRGSVVETPEGYKLRF